MSILPILLWPDQRLTAVSAAVLPEDVRAGKLDELIQDLFDTMYDAGGVGISAVQVGVTRRVFVMEVHGKDHVFFNPQVTSSFGVPEEKNEGCLSIPGHYELVKRHPKVHVEALDRNGDRFDLEFQNMEAQCVQHELEHLDGRLMIDHLGHVAKGRLQAKMKKLRERADGK